MIDIDRLRFPTGTGVAVILKSPGAGAKKSLVLVAGILLGALIYVPSGLPQITSPADPSNLQQRLGSKHKKPTHSQSTSAASHTKPSSLDSPASKHTTHSKIHQTTCHCEKPMNRPTLT